MPSKKEEQPFNVAEAMLAAYATNNRINVFLIGNLPDAAWRAKPPEGKGRDIASMAAHIHNVRLMWLESAGKTEKMPAKLKPDSCSKEDAVKALEASAEAVSDLLSKSLTTDGKVRGFKPDAVSFFSYLVAHDAHHRGQMSMLARQLGHPLPQSAMYGMWEWGKR